MNFEKNEKTGIGFVEFNYSSTQSQCPVFRLRYTKRVIVNGCSIELLSQTEFHYKAACVEEREKIKEKIVSKNNFINNEKNDNSTETKHVDRRHHRTCKVYLSGLKKNISDKKLLDYFERFGKVICVKQTKNFMKNEKTGMGFVEFICSSTHSQCPVFKLRQHKHIIINGCNIKLLSGYNSPRGNLVDINSNYSRDNGSNVNKLRANSRHKKNDNLIFCCGLRDDITDQNLREYFSVYGKVSCNIVYRT